jgi:hypothetical protein
MVAEPAVTPDGRPSTVTVTAPSNPPDRTTLTVTFPVVAARAMADAPSASARARVRFPLPPASSESVLGLTDIVNDGVGPVPSSPPPPHAATRRRRTGTRVDQADRIRMLRTHELGKAERIAGRLGKVKDATLSANAAITVV